MLAVDQTLKGLHVESKQLLAGTKGSHFLTSHPGGGALCGATGAGLISRRKFVDELWRSPCTSGCLCRGQRRPAGVRAPFGERVLVGTTDEPFHGDPADAVATPRELEYLVSVVNHLFPDLHLTIDDVEQHYCGVRPLPYVGPSTPAAVTRRHWVEMDMGSTVPLYSIIGGKLTTCRSLAKEVIAMLLGKIGHKEPIRDEKRPILDLAKRHNSPALNEEMLHGTLWSITNVRRIIRDEWVTCLDDLVERRLMLLFDKTIQRKTLVQLARELVAAQKLEADQVDTTVEQVIKTLQRRYGKQVQ